MTIQVKCSGCGTSYQVADTMAGRKCKCKKCGNLMEVPHASGPLSPPPQMHAVAGGGQAATSGSATPRGSNKTMVLLLVGGGVIVLVGLLAVVIVVVMLGLYRNRIATAISTTPRVPTHTFFVDENTGEVCVQALDAVPPLPNKDGKPMLVRAIFYTFGTDDEKKIAYLEKYTDAGKAALQADPAMDGVNPGDSLVRLPDPDTSWVRADSPAGQKIIESLADAASKPGFRIVMPR